MKDWLFKAYLMLFSITLSAINFDELDQFIDHRKEQYKVPGLAIAIVENDEIVFSKGYGIAKVGSDQAVNPETIFQIASISKTFAAAALGKCVDQGKMSWEEEIHSYLPQFLLKSNYATRHTTSVDLLAHRTGLPSFQGDLLNVLGYNANEALNRIAFIDPACSFREKSNYSNVGYFIAGQVLEAVAKMKWEDFINYNFFQPLEMHRSGFIENLQKENIAHAHLIVDGNPKTIPWNTSHLFVAAGGVASTALDLANWAKMHLNKGVFKNQQILSSKVIEEMHKPSMLAKGSFTQLPELQSSASFSYALGWNNYHFLGQTIVEKGGALEGVRSLVTLLPEKKIGIVILANLNLTVLPELIRTFIVDQYLNVHSLDEKEFVKAQEQINQLLAMPVTDHAIPLKYPMNSFIGVYENPVYGLVEVIKDQEQLTLVAGPAKLKGNLSFYSNNTFVLDWHPLVNLGRQQVTFLLGPEGEAIEFQTDSIGTFKKFKKE